MHSAYENFTPPTTVLQRGVVDTQLIAHDKEVYDIAWGGVGVFASVSADGSVRVFDLRYVAPAGMGAQYAALAPMTVCARCPCCHVLRMLTVLRQSL